MIQVMSTLPLTKTLLPLHLQILVRQKQLLESEVQYYQQPEEFIFSQNSKNRSNSYSLTSGYDEITDNSVPQHKKKKQ